MLEKTRNELRSQLLLLGAPLRCSDNPQVIGLVLFTTPNQTPQESQPHRNHPTIHPNSATHQTQPQNSPRNEHRHAIGTLQYLRLLLGLVETLSESVQLLDRDGRVGVQRRSSHGRPNSLAKPFRKSAKLQKYTEMSAEWFQIERTQDTLEAQETLQHKPRAISSPSVRSIEGSRRQNATKLSGSLTLALNLRRS